MAPARPTRSRLLGWVLAGLTVLVAWGVWAVSLAVVALPMQRLAEILVGEELHAAGLTRWWSRSAA